ncbi:MAG: YgaP family membrane protein [Acidimicrobiales bacterium]
MNLDRAVLAVAGTVVLLSLVLTLAVSSWWLLLTAFVGLNLLQASFTGFWPAAVHLGRFGVPSGCAFTAPSRNAQRRVPSAHH